MENKQLESIETSLKHKKLGNLKDHLRVCGWKKITANIFWSIIAVIAGVFIIVTAIRENEYYSSKEGSDRAPSGYATQTEVLDETEPTPTAIAEYTVAAQYPRYLSIEKLGIHNAKIIQVGLKSNNEVGTPNNIFDAGWYNGSDLPGTGGTAIIDGHNGGLTKSGIFKTLPSLAIGDLITIERGNGTFLTYSVAENVAVPLSEANDYMLKARVSPVQGKESITLITCSGKWNGKTYDHRQFVRATLVE